MNARLRAAHRNDLPSTSLATATPDWSSLYARWRRLGLYLTATATSAPVDLEPLILETATHLGGDERLAVCVATWLARHHDLVDGRRLSELARRAPGSTRARLAVLLSLATHAPGGAGTAPQFAAALSHCRAVRQSRPLYDAVARLPTLARMSKEASLPLYARWGLWHDDDTLKPSALLPTEAILQVPELRLRALCGPSIEAACLGLTVAGPTNARSLSHQLMATYAAVHAAVARLVGRGLLQVERIGPAHQLRPTPFLLAALRSR